MKSMKIKEWQSVPKITPFYVIVSVVLFGTDERKLSFDMMGKYTLIVSVYFVVSTTEVFICLCSLCFLVSVSYILFPVFIINILLAPSIWMLTSRPNEWSGYYTRGCDEF